MTDLAELATIEFWPTRDIYSLGFEILVDHERLDPTRNNSYRVTMQWWSETWVGLTQVWDVPLASWLLQ